ncbi:hypothetical protein I79_021163 [Cricetulus griseus]|uniref:Uncharacterized protein n=1 Tax=Cricetulus griseus TaxID=10029 RepID=G3IBX9_CRIGR|nr:hypothetical protein I79_021163 [Cricetulus griseus]
MVMRAGHMQSNVSLGRFLLCSHHYQQLLGRLNMGKIIPLLPDCVCVSLVGIIHVAEWTLGGVDIHCTELYQD